MSEQSPSVRHVEDRSRFELVVDDEVAGFAAYRREGDAYAFTHTEVDEAYEGKGLGSQLLSDALRQVEATGSAVLPYCAFVRSYLESHPDLVHLVPAEARSRFGLG